jgi:hypothetical protein
VDYFLTVKRGATTFCLPFALAQPRGPPPFSIDELDTRDLQVLFLPNHLQRRGVMRTLSQAATRSSSLQTRLGFEIRDLRRSN